MRLLAFHLVFRSRSVTENHKDERCSDNHKDYSGDAEDQCCESLDLNRRSRDGKDICAENKNGLIRTQRFRRHAKRRPFRRWSCSRFLRSGSALRTRFATEKVLQPRANLVSAPEEARLCRTQRSALYQSQIFH